jgi:sec-independent protein translocase protein TatA
LVEETLPVFGIGFPELIVIVVVVLLVFGPGKLSEIGSALGQGLRDFQRAFHEHDRPKDAAEKPKSVDAVGARDNSS